MRDQLHDLFSELNDQIEEINRDRRKDGLAPFPKARVRLLGQISLMSDEKAAAILSLAQTGDVVDAILLMDNLIKAALQALLKKQGLVYDEDSYLIWIPPGATFHGLFEFENVIVESIDPESALVSKAVKAPEKNRQLIREAIACDEFPALVDRILENGGVLEEFA